LAIIAALGGLGGIGGILSARAAWREARTGARRADLEALQTVIENLRAEYERLVTDEGALRDEIAAMRAQCETLKQENEELRSEISRLGRENAALRRSLARMDIELRAAQDRYERLYRWALQNGLDPEEIERE